MKLFRLNGKPTKVLLGIFAGLSSQKKGMELTWLNVGSLCERIIGNDGAELSHGSQHDFRTASEFSCDGLLDASCHEVQITFRCLENNVAALHVSLRLLELERQKQRAQGVHFDYGVAADVDTAQEANYDRHSNRLGASS